MADQEKKYLQQYESFHDLQSLHKNKKKCFKLFKIKVLNIKLKQNIKYVSVFNTSLIS